MTMETKELVISEELRKKVDMICRLACVKYELMNGSFINIKSTNIAYTKPHILKVDGNDYLLFDVRDDVFTNGYVNRIMKIKQGKNQMNILINLKLFWVKKKN